MRRHVRRSRFRVAPALVLLGALPLWSGCDLEEITLVEAEDVVIAEVYVQLSHRRPEASRATAWLHRTLDSGSPSSQPVPGAQILITSASGFSAELAEAQSEYCATGTPVAGTGTCYATTSAIANRFHPGDQLTVEVVLPGGGLITGTSTVPGDFGVLHVPVVPAARCYVEAETPTTLRWTRSEGAWAYVNETLISGLRAAWASRGIEVEQDPLYLLGLSISAADTTIVFPGEFGVFNRTELDQDVAVALQDGLPVGTLAGVTITAADRNYVNWIRGGNFNPSGQVRVPSLRGDGTGVFGTSVTDAFEIRVLAPGAPSGAPMCSGE